MSELHAYLEVLSPSYIARFPNSENSNRITQMLETGVLDYSRLQDGGDEVTMNYPNPLVEG